MQWSVCNCKHQARFPIEEMGSVEIIWKTPNTGKFALALPPQFTEPIFAIDDWALKPSCGGFGIDIGLLPCFRRGLAIREGLDRCLFATATTMEALKGVPTLATLGRGPNQTFASHERRQTRSSFACWPLSRTKRMTNACPLDAAHLNGGRSSGMVSRAKVASVLSVSGTER